MSTIVTISYSESDETIESVRKALEEVSMYDPNWNGTAFVIERGDYTCVDTDDEISGAALLHEVIFPAISGE